MILVRKAGMLKMFLLCSGSCDLCKGWPGAENKGRVDTPCHAVVFLLTRILSIVSILPCSAPAPGYPLGLGQCFPLAHPSLCIKIRQNGNKTCKLMARDGGLGYKLKNI